jgi:hypothetical protein
MRKFVRGFLLSTILLSSMPAYSFSAQAAGVGVYTASSDSVTLDNGISITSEILNDGDIPFKNPIIKLNGETIWRYFNNVKEMTINFISPQIQYTMTDNGDTFITIADYQGSGGFCDEKLVGINSHGEVFLNKSWEGVKWMETRFTSPNEWERAEPIFDDNANGGKLTAKRFQVEKYHLFPNGEMFLVETHIINDEQLMDDWDKNMQQLNPTIVVYIDGVIQNYDQQPLLSNGSVLVPMRSIFESLGATVSWDAGSQMVTATKGDKIITLRLSDDNMTINGNSVGLNTPAISVNGHTLVPVRVISEALGASVKWNGDTKTVSIEQSTQSDLHNSVGEIKPLVQSQLSALLNEGSDLFPGAGTFDSKDDLYTVYTSHFTRNYVDRIILPNYKQDNQGKWVFAGQELREGSKYHISFTEKTKVENNGDTIKITEEKDPSINDYSQVVTLRYTENGWRIDDLKWNY